MLCICKFNAICFLVYGMEVLTTRKLPTTHQHHSFNVWVSTSEFCLHNMTCLSFTLLHLYIQCSFPFIYYSWHGTINTSQTTGKSPIDLIYSLNKKEWICSLFKEWILEKSEFGVNICVIHSFWVTSGITRNPWVIPVVTPKWVNNTNVHSKFTLISLFSKIHSLKSEHIHSFLFREYNV